MSKTPNGGPAFPHVRVHPDTSGTVKDGMTLRDYFAAAVLQGIIAAHTQYSVNHKRVVTEQEHAQIAFLMADAMLAERDK